ncbi:MAG: hypothetical protein ACP5OK_04320, partial [Thermoprotei archaeon]
MIAYLDSLTKKNKIHIAHDKNPQTLNKNKHTKTKINITTEDINTKVKQIHYKIPRTKFIKNRPFILGLITAIIG